MTYCGKYPIRCPWPCKHVDTCGMSSTEWLFQTPVWVWFYDMKTQYIILSPENQPWVLHTSSPFESPVPTFFSQFFFFSSSSTHTHLSPSSLWKCAADRPLLTPNHLTQSLYPTSIVFRFSMRINCSVLYSGINSWNTATVNNLLSVWEKNPGSGSGSLQPLGVRAASCGSLSIHALKESLD